MNETVSSPQPAARNATFLGAIAIFLGVLAMLAPGLTGLSVALMVGILVLLAGLARMAWAFQARSLGQGLLTFALGALMLLCGVALVANPLLGSGLLTILLTVYLVVDGLLEIAAGVRGRPAHGWGWLVFGGIISVLLGLLIWSQYPLSGAFAIGILLGIKLFFTGLIMVAAGSAARAAVREP